MAPRQGFIQREVSFTGLLAGIEEVGILLYTRTTRSPARQARSHGAVQGLTADELLELKILEPAMGSAAFLVETTNQLADLYLERKQRRPARRSHRIRWSSKSRRYALSLLTGTALGSTSIRSRLSSARSRSGSTACMTATFHHGSAINFTRATR